MQQRKITELSSWDVAYAANMTIACLLSYWIMTDALSSFVDRPSDLLGGMWAAVATIFVFRDTRARSLSAGIARLNCNLRQLRPLLDLPPAVFLYPPGNGRTDRHRDGDDGVVEPARRHRHHGYNHRRRHGRRGDQS